MSLSLLFDFCVFLTVQSNDHSRVITVFCNPLFYTSIPVRILSFLIPLFFYSCDSRLLNLSPYCPNHPPILIQIKIRSVMGFPSQTMLILLERGIRSKYDCTNTDVKSQAPWALSKSISTLKYF